MTLLIIPGRGFYGWFATWDLAGLFAALLEETSQDRAAREVTR